MASFIMPTASIALSGATMTVREALSGVFGSISLTAWICLLDVQLPQLIANYKAQSADGLSMGFLFIWLLGDATNLAGALLTHLAPTAVALAFYFCIADIVLIAQCMYYNAKNARRTSRHQHARTTDGGDRILAEEDTPGEEDTLLGGERRRTSSTGLPGSQRRHEVHTETSLEPLRKIVTGEDDTPDSNPWLHNTMSLIAVWVVGAAGWAISFKAGAWRADHGDSGPESPEQEGTMATVGLALGYFSAVCYLLARVPQIIKNYRDKSCEGLALLFFLLSLTGNLSYGASLIAFSQEKHYLLKALPWLLGSLGTIAEDIVIFAQFHMYATDRTTAPPSAA
ncbi:hypothetical protein ACHAQA_007701 [Verticillium albo-atrum]